MDFEEDYMMKQIRRFACYLSIMFIGKKDPVYVWENEAEPSETDKLHMRILRLLDDGQLCEAEDELYDAFEPTREWLGLSLDLYDRLNSMTDEQLERGNFPREEIRSGIEDVLRRLNIPEQFEM